MTTQANGVSGFAVPTAWVSNMFNTRNAQYSCTSVGVLRVTSMNTRAGFASQGLPLVSIAASATPATRLPTMVNRHSKTVVSAPSTIEPALIGVQ
jgi:hypothetical protein